MRRKHELSSRMVMAAIRHLFSVTPSHGTSICVRFWMDRALRNDPAGQVIKHRRHTGAGDRMFPWNHLWDLLDDWSFLQDTQGLLMERFLRRNFLQWFTKLFLKCLKGAFIHRSPEKQGEFQKLVAT